MFVFETDQAPIYVMRFVGRFTPADETIYLDCLQALVERPPGFILVLDLRNENRMSHEGNKQQAAWFKRNRPHLGQICRGMVRVRADIDPHTHDDANFRKAMPFPIANMNTEAEALAWARSILETPA